MMGIHLLLWMFLLIGLSKLEDPADPCKDSKELFLMNIRYAAFKVDQKSSFHLEDFFLERGWYKVGKTHMIQSYPGNYRCSTFYPIYMKGGTDIADGEEVTREICAFDYYTKKCKTSTKPIKIKNCTDYNVYLLHPTDEYEAYCFEDTDEPPIDKNEVAPTEQITENPVVSCAIQNATDGSFMYSCSCTFTALNDISLHYQVNWYKNGHLIYVSNQMLYEDIGETNFNDDRFGGLGLTVSCEVRISKGKKRLPGRVSPCSKGVFLGIKIGQGQDKIRIRNHPNVTIPLTSTMPVYCVNYNITSCHIRLVVFVPGEQKCTTKIALRHCSLKIADDKWNQNHSLVIYPKITGKYANNNSMGKMRHFYIHLRTINNSFVPKIWGGYELPPVKIELENTEENNEWEEKSCYAHSDPHMKTFDGLHYENQNPGTYLMYRNSETVFGVMEVQVKMGKCLGFRPNIYCVCGLAVRAGQDVYKIDRCNQTDRVEQKYMACGSDYLDVRKVTEWKYQIYLPTGTFISSYQWSRFLEVDIYPSADDVNKSEGLCGKLNNNKHDDFIHRGNVSEKVTKYLNERKFDRHPQDFTYSWKVSDQDNILLKNTTSEIWEYVNRDPPTKISLCECHNMSRIICNGSKIANNCKNIKNKQVYCNLKGGNSRKRRFAHQPQNIVPNYLQERHRKRIKREESAIIQVNMTKEEARLHCEKRLNKSPSFRACKNVPNVYSTVSVDHCVADIMLSQTLVWEYAAREGLKGGCIKELQQNMTLSQKPNDGSQSIAEKIFQIACPNECSNNGICTNGKCQCRGTYGSADCSMDLTDPPIVNGINIDEGGLCDINECNVAFVYGDNFLDTNTLTCMITHFEIDINNTVTKIGQHIIVADHQTVAEIHCSLAQITSKQGVTTITRGNPFVRKMLIAISNDGNNFGDNHTLFILDSKCQDTSDKNGTLMFSLKSGWCFINGQCVIHTGINKNDVSEMCDVSRDRFSWSDVPTTQASTTMPSSPLGSTSMHVTRIPVTDIDQRSQDDIKLIVGMSTVGIILLAVIIIMVVLFRKRQWRDYIVNKGKPTNPSESGRDKMAPVSTISLNFHDVIGYEVKICGNQTHGEKSNRMCDEQSLFNISEGQQRTENAENTDKTSGKNECGDYIHRPFNSSQSD